MTKDIRLIGVEFEGKFVVVRYTKLVGPNSRARMFVDLGAKHYWKLVENNKLIEYLDKL